MFIAVVGTPGAGKKSVRDYLVNKGYEILTADAFNATSSAHKVVVDGAIPPEIPAEPCSYNSASGSSTDVWTDAMLRFVTSNWRANYVTTCLNTASCLEPFKIRPFFLLVNVDAPVMMRWKRRCHANPNPPTLEKFIQENDSLIYDRDEIPRPAVNIVNKFKTIAELHAYLDELDLTNGERLRPGWDSYFMTLARLASLRSNCMKRRVGAILVRNNRILSTGYNGTPRNLTNCNQGGCSRCNGGASEAYEECVCLHAEENALLEAGRERVGDGAVLYCNTCPCLRCTVKIVQVGVKEVVYNLGYKMDEASAKVFREAGIKLRQHSPPHD